MSIKVKTVNSGYEYDETFYSLNGKVGYSNDDWVFCFETIHPHYVVMRAFILTSGSEDSGSIDVEHLFEVYQRGWDDRTIYAFGQINSVHSSRSLEDGIIEFSPGYDGTIDIMGDRFNSDPYDLRSAEQFFKKVRTATEICNDLMKKEADPLYTPQHTYEPIRVANVYMSEGIFIPEP